MSYSKYINRYHHIDLYEQKRKCPIFSHFRRRQAAKMVIFRLSLISKKLKCFRTPEWYFQKQLTIEVIWAKYEEIRNLATVISFSVFTGIGS